MLAHVLHDPGVLEGPQVKAVSSEGCSPCMTHLQIVSSDQATVLLLVTHIRSLAIGDFRFGEAATTGE